MVRIGWIFTWLYPFSICGYLAVTLGYDFFQAEHPDGIEGLLFLFLAGSTFFLAFHLINAFTDGLPAWCVSFPVVPYTATNQQKRRLLIIHVMIHASIYVTLMTILIGDFSLERISIPIAIGLLTFLLLTSLVSMLAPLCMIWKKDESTSNPDAE